MSIVYDLLVEQKIRDNTREVKRMYNALLSEAKQDLAVFKNEFQTLNETTNVNDQELRTGFRSVSDCLKEAKELIIRVEESESLKEQQELTKKAFRVIEEGMTLREALMEDFSNTVDQVEKVFESVN